MKSESLSERVPKNEKRERTEQTTRARELCFIKKSVVDSAVYIPSCVITRTPPHPYFENISTNFITNAQINSKRKKHIKVEESKNGQEDTSMNRDENTNRVEDIHVEKDKELAEKEDKVDEKISRNSHLIFDRDAILHKFLSIGKTLEDIITA